MSGAAVPAVGLQTRKSPLPPLKIEAPYDTDQPRTHEDRKVDSNTGPLFDPHAAGCEVVDGDHPAYRSSHSTLNHSDLTEDGSMAYERSTRKRRRSLHDSKGKRPTPIATPAPHIHPGSFEDPISDEFWEDIWVACAEHNVSARSVSPRILTYRLSQTETYRKVFHAVPDDTVTTWKAYKHFVAYHERFSKTVSPGL